MVCKVYLRRDLRCSGNSLICMILGEYGLEGAPKNAHVFIGLH